MVVPSPPLDLPDATRRRRRRGVNIWSDASPRPSDADGAGAPGDPTSAAAVPPNAPGLPRSSGYAPVSRRSPPRAGAGATTASSRPSAARWAGRPIRPTSGGGRPHVFLAPLPLRHVGRATTIGVRHNERIARSSTLSRPAGPGTRAAHPQWRLRRSPRCAHPTMCSSGQQPVSPCIQQGVIEQNATVADNQGASGAQAMDVGSTRHRPTHASPSPPAPPPRRPGAGDASP